MGLSKYSWIAAINSGTEPKVPRRTSKSPPTIPGPKAQEYFGGVLEGVTRAVLHGPVLLQLHALLGLTLAVFSIYQVVHGMTTHRGGLITATVCGFIGAVGGGFNGGSFLNYNADFSSMLMSAGFALAIVAYLFALYLALLPRAIKAVQA